MPYRRLPNTDLARLRAMKTAYQMGREIHPTALAFTQSTYTKLELFINSFETAVQQYREAYNRQAESSAIYIPIAQKARLYVSHFIQVVNMAVLRGELKPNVRTYYQLPVDEGKLPPKNNTGRVSAYQRRAPPDNESDNCAGKSALRKVRGSLYSASDTSAEYCSYSLRARCAPRNGRPDHSRYLG